MVGQFVDEDDDNNINTYTERRKIDGHKHRTDDKWEVVVRQTRDRANVKIIKS